jgi:acetyl/propionyl-CoA carboxylase alpha subunit
VLDRLGQTNWILVAPFIVTMLRVPLVFWASIWAFAPPGQLSTFDTLPYLGGVSAEAAASGQLAAPMMGKVVAIRAMPGDRVTAGQIVIVLESMKMELHVNAPFDATVQAVRCGLGEMVERGVVLAEVSAAAPPDKE